MKKILTLFLAAALLLSMAGCAGGTGPIDPQAVYSHLLTDVAYDAPLTDASDLAGLYFTGLPAGATVKLSISSSGYYPDEVAMFTAASKSDVEAIKQSIQNHISQVRTQFQNYLPEEVATIDNAIIWDNEQTVVLVITSDTVTAKSLLERAHELEYVAPPTTTEPPTTATTAPPETTVAPTTEPTVPPTTEPQIPVLQSQSGVYSVYSNGVVKVDNCAFEPYGYDSYVAGTYASEVSEVADKLAGITNVYCLPIPTAISVMLPDDIIAKYPRYHNQGAEIEDIFTKMSANVNGINCYEALMLHRDEYLYYRTDYHWNGPAAYYAYEEFCKAKGFTPYTMEQREVAYFDNFLGLLYSNSSGYDPALGATPDTVIAYYPYSKNATMFYIDTAGNKFDYPIIADVSNWKAGGKYLCYAAADQPYAEFHNPDVTDGSSLVLVKESYGNVLLSYLVDHYSVIYEIDYRYWKGSIVDFAKEVGATDLLFANNMAMISGGVLVAMLASITY